MGGTVRSSKFEVCQFPGSVARPAVWKYELLCGIITGQSRSNIARSSYMRLDIPVLLSSFSRIIFKFKYFQNLKKDFEEKLHSLAQTQLQEGISRGVSELTERMAVVQKVVY